MAAGTEVPHTRVHYVDMRYLLARVDLVNCFYSLIAENRR